MILMAEVFGVIFALSGAFILSKKPHKKLGSIAWVLFICADILHATVYYNNNQTGMVFNQVTGIFLCSIGLTQYLLQNKALSSKITNFMFGLFFAFISFGFLMIFVNIFNFSIANLEWMIAIFAISGTTLMASRHRNSKYVYIIWIFCDIVFLSLCLMNQQYAIATLRIVFICININGIKNWFTSNIITHQ